MKFSKISYNNQIRWAIFEENEFSVISAKPWEHWERTGEKLRKEAVKILAPVDPTNIIGIGKNYKSNFEKGEPYPKKPILFLKSKGTIAFPNDTIRIPKYSKKVFIEGELVVIIAKKCRNVSKGNALDYVFGYTCCNDLTAVDMLEEGMKWVEAKSADGFLPIGPVIETKISERAVLETKLNGEIVQQTTIDQLVFGVAELISYVSSVLTLKPGDLILTGSPAGAQIANDDVVTIAIEGIGTLKNCFKDE